MANAVRWLSGITAILVLVQAVLIGQVIGLGDLAQQALHGTLGSGTFIAAILMSACAFLALRRGELRGSALVLSIIATLLIVAQLGLGYIGRREGLAAAIHVPNGVLITGLLCSLLTLTFATAAEEGRARS